MEVTGLQWLVTILIIAGLLAFDFVFHVRKAHEPSVKEAAIWSSIYIRHRAAVRSVYFS